MTETLENTHQTVNTLCRTQTFYVRFRQKAEFLIKISTKFLDIVTIRQNRKDHSLPAIFVIYSIFNNRNQISLSSSKVYDNLITVTENKVRVPMLVGEL